jgi:hypothetical protein
VSIRISNIKIAEERLSWWPVHGIRSNVKFKSHRTNGNLFAVAFIGL